MAMAMTLALSPLSSAVSRGAPASRLGASGRMIQSLNATSSSGRVMCDATRGVSPTTRAASATPKRQDPLRSFPWDVAAKRFVARSSDLAWSALKWLTIPVLLVSSASELAYTLIHGKALFVPLSMLVGIILAGIMNEVAKEVSPSLRKGFPFHLVAIGFAFGLMKLPGPSYPFWGRIILPHLANGGLWQTCYLAWRGLKG